VTIVGLTTIHPNPGVKWEDVQKQIKKACDLSRKHGAEDVTVMVTMIGGRATNTIGVTSRAEDWTRFGQVQQALQRPRPKELVFQILPGHAIGLAGALDDGSAWSRLTAHEERYADDAFIADDCDLGRSAVFHHIQE